MDLHYKGNTVIAPHPGKKRRRQTAAIGFGNVLQTEKSISYEPKVCATSKCVWCVMPFGQYMIRCPYCRNCQYCGFIIQRNASNCQNCGNFLPPEITPQKTVLVATSPE